MSKHKEFWVQNYPGDAFTEYWSVLTEKPIPQVTGFSHVIEYEAYDEMKQLCSELVVDLQKCGGKFNAIVDHESYESAVYGADIARAALEKARKVLKDE